MSTKNEPLHPLSRWAVREMMAHRGLSVSDVAKEAGYSKGYALRVLRGHHGQGVAYNRIEDAITRLTDRKGGVPDGCCSQAALEEMEALLKIDPDTREEFGRGW